MAIPVSRLYAVQVEPQLHKLKAELYVKDPEVWGSPLRWVSLYPLGYLNYVLFEDGTVVKLDEFGMATKHLKQTLRGQAKRKSVTLAFAKVSSQYFVHAMVAWAFLERSPEVASRAGREIFFKDGDTTNVHVSNLSWEPIYLEDLLK